MTANPLLNAAAGLGYIILVALTIHAAPAVMQSVPDVLIFAAVLCLFVFSACITSYIFLGESLRLFVIERDYKAAAALFLKTLGTFLVLGIGFVALSITFSTSL